MYNLSGEYRVHASAIDEQIGKRRPKIFIVGNHLFERSCSLPTKLQKTFESLDLDLSSDDSSFSSPLFLPFNTFNHSWTTLFKVLFMVFSDFMSLQIIFFVKSPFS